MNAVRIQTPVRTELVEGAPYLSLTNGNLCCREINVRNAFDTLSPNGGWVGDD